MPGLSVPRLDDLDDAALAAAYEPPRLPWLRLNFVVTVDGRAQGVDGLSKSINNEADGRVFAALRERADVVIVGAGTVRAEAYRPNAKPFVVVSRQGDVPESLREGSLDRVFVATCADAGGLEEAQSLLGEDRVWVLGESTLDLADLRRRLEDAGFAEMLCEGGPHLAADLVTAGVVDELCLTTVPRLIGGDDRLGVVSGGQWDAHLELGGLIESDGTLLARWLLSE